MYIHNYQIHNVLNVFQRQLTQESAKGKQKSAVDSKVNSQLNYKRDRQTIIEKVASNVLEKINLLDSGTQSSGKFDNVLHRDAQKGNTDPKKNKEFFFNVIDQNNQKIANSISIDNAEGLIYTPNETIQSDQTAKIEINLQNKMGDDKSSINIKV